MRKRTTGQRALSLPTGWKYMEDNVGRYYPDREIILKLYEEADRLMQR